MGVAASGADLSGTFDSMYSPRGIGEQLSLSTGGGGVTEENRGDCMVRKDVDGPTKKDPIERNKGR